MLLSALFALALTLYSLACALYIAFLARGVERLGAYGGWSLAAAVVAHIAQLVVEALGSTSVFFGDIHQALAMGSLLVAVVYLIGIGTAPNTKFRVLGAFITPITLLFFLGAGLHRGVGHVSEEVRSLMLPIHILVNVLGIVCFALAFGVSIAYVIQERQLRQKRMGGLFQRLPSLDTLDTLAFRMVIVGFPLLTLGVVTGSLWAVRLDPDAPPIGATQTMALLTWTLFAAVLLLRAIAGWRGRRAAIGTMLGFACACCVLVGYVIQG